MCQWMRANGTPAGSATALGWSSPMTDPLLRLTDVLLSVVVPGAPVTQGSMALLNRATGNLGYPAKTIAHRNLVVGELVEYWAGRDQLTGPVRVRCRFELP